jgi:hypothetical protein
VHVLGQLFLCFVLVAAAGMALSAVSRAAFSHGAPRGARTAMRSPGIPRAARAGTGRSVLSAVTHPGDRQARAKARADITTTWHKAAATDWLEERRLARKNGTAITSGGGTAAEAPRTPLADRFRRAGIGVAIEDGGHGSAQAPPAPARTVPLPVPRVPAPPTSTNGGTTVAPTTAGAEQMIEGINRIHAEAAAGGIRHKQAALKSANEASIRFSGMAQMIARTMSEPGNNYGPEITEPLGQAAQHLQAAAMAFGESDNALTSLIHMTVGELADSPRQAPHHTELSENGSR